MLMVSLGFVHPHCWTVALTESHRPGVHCYGVQLGPLNVSLSFVHKSQRPARA